MVVWDIFGEKGHPVRATVSDLGPLLLARLLNLNDVQSGVLNIIFRIADDQGLLLLDFKDLRAITQYIGDNAKSFQNQYGNISSASVGAIQRGLLSLEQQGAAHFFGEPMLDIKDWMRSDTNGKGVINILTTTWASITEVSSRAKVSCGKMSRIRSRVWDTSEESA